MEDLSVLWEEDLEGDFLHLLSKGFPKDMFEQSAKAMLGDDWRTIGLEIVGSDAKAKKQFSKYTK